jgi:hypothetical protein
MKKKKENKDYEKAEKGYEFSISLLQYHTQLLWQEFGVFLLIQTIIIGFIGTTLSNEFPNKTWLIIMAILGLLICLPWYSTFLHNYEYYLLRIAQAKKYEAILGLDLLLEGKNLYSTDGVEIGEQKLKHGAMAKNLPPKTAFLLLILLFALIFLQLLLTFKNIA